MFRPLGMDLSCALEYIRLPALSQRERDPCLN